jgi:preprotein translocase subunit SecA
MDYLKEGIGLRAMAQRDPLIEYQREGFALYQGMMQSIKSESVGFLFNLEVDVQQAPGDPAHPSVAAKGLARDEASGNLSYSAPAADGSVEVRNQRGQVEAAATRLAQRQQERATAPAQQPAPQQRPGAAPAARGAFGQKAEGEQPINRAQRRAQEKGR